MVKFYVMKIRYEEMTIDDVPSLWREKVKNELEEGGKCA